MLSTHINASREVFSRIEDDRHLLLVRPNGSDSPLVHLLGDPAPEVWRFVDGGASPEELAPFRENAAVRDVFHHLFHHRFIEFDPFPEPHEERRETQLAGCYRDPWKYQFSKPYLSRPWFVLWEVTDRCSQKGKCLFCYRPDVAPPDPGPAQCERIIQQLVASEIPFVTLLGGEPLCHGGILDIIVRLRSHNIYTKVITNGLLVDDDLAARLGVSGLNQVAVSLDGLDAEVHELSRGEGTFERAINAIGCLQRHLPRVSISFTVSSRSFEQVDSLTTFCGRHGVREVYISPLRGKNGQQRPLGADPLSNAQMASLHEKVAARNREGINVIGLRECSCGRSSCVIHADGRFSPCPFADSYFGNIYDEELTAIWSRVNDVAVAVGGVPAGGYCFRRFESPNMHPNQ